MADDSVDEEDYENLFGDLSYDDDDFWNTHVIFCDNYVIVKWY